MALIDLATNQTFTPHIISTAVPKPLQSVLEVQSQSCKKTATGVEVCSVPFTTPSLNFFFFVISCIYYVFLLIVFYPWRRTFFLEVMKNIGGHAKSSHLLQKTELDDVLSLRHFARFRWDQSWGNFYLLIRTLWFYFMFTIHRTFILFFLYNTEPSSPDANSDG